MSIHKLILGTAQLGLNYGINNIIGKPAFEEANQILELAFEKGIRTLDTAGAYGDSHRVIGNYHNKNSKNKFKIITKLPKSFDKLNLNSIISVYLQELNVERIEVLMFHSFESYKNYSDEIESLKSNSFVNKIGVSVYSNEEIEFLINDLRIDLVQLPFNLFDNNNKRGKIIKKLKDSGKTVHTRSVFLQGLFFKKNDSENMTVKNLKSELKNLLIISKKYKIGVPEMSLLYCLKQDNIDMVLFGVESTNQLIENLKSVQYGLDHKLIREIESINIKNNNFLNPSLWNK